MHSMVSRSAGVARCRYSQDSPAKRPPFFVSELCWGRVMLAYAKPQLLKKEEGERLICKGDRIKFIDLRFRRRQAVGIGKGRKQDVPSMG